MQTPLERRLFRRDDRQEFRELILYRTDIGASVWHVVRFASDPDFCTRNMEKIGTEDAMRQFVAQETKRLCEDEGFSLVPSSQH
jgi:hypothetical protein